MVFAHVLVTEAECTAMAGELVDTSGWVTTTNVQAWANQASAYLCALCEYDFVTNVATLEAQAKNMLAEYIARYCAACGILYNVNGFATDSNAVARLAAESMVQFHAWRMFAIEKLLKQKTILDYVK